MNALALAYAAILTWTYPSVDAAGLPEHDLWFCELQTRVDHPDSTWHSDWRVGARHAEGLPGITAIPLNGRAMWFRIACRDSTGNLAAYSDSVRKIP